MEAIIEGAIIGFTMLIAVIIGYGYTWEKKEGKNKGVY